VRTRLLAITLAAVLGLLGVVAVLAYVRQANERAVNGLKAVTVLMATGAIPAGTSLNKAKAEDLLGTEQVPASSLSNAGVRSVTKQNGGEVVSGAVPKGFALQQDMLTSRTSVTPSAGFVLPPNTVAVAVNLCASEAVAGYATPGSEVAVFDTRANGDTQRECDANRQIVTPGTISNINSANTLLVLKAKVLAVGQNPASQGANGATGVTVNADPASSSSSSSDDEVLVTLAVNQKDAERLILIAEVGLPYMALLGPSSNTAFTPPVNLFPQQP
jgi:pilus assembly protein CpaB